MKPVEKVDETIQEIDDESTESLTPSWIQGFRVFKSRFLWLTITLLVGTILFLISIPSFFDNSALKFQIEQKTSQSFDANLIINGDVTVSLFPTPAIVAKEVLLRNYKKGNKTYNLYAKSVRLKLAFFNFLLKDFSVSKIVFHDAILEYFYNSTEAIPKQDQFTEIAEKIDAEAAQNHEKKSGSFSLSLFPVDKFQESQLNSGNMPDIQIKNGTIISYNQNSRKKEIAEIDSIIKSDTIKINASGKFTNDKISNNFRLTAYFNSDADKQDSLLELGSESMSLIIRGGFTTENHDILTSDFNGKVEAEIYDLRSFYKDYINGSSAIYAKLQPSAKSIKISADVKNSGGEISLDTIIINSNSLTGTGNAILDISTDIPRLDVHLDLENLDLDAIWSNDRIDIATTSNANISANNTDEVIETLSTTISSNTATAQINGASSTDKNPEDSNLQIVNQFKNFDLSAEIKAKNVNYLEGQIKDLSLYLTVSKDGQILILPMILNIPGEGILRVNGVLSNSNNVPKFLGKLDATGKKLGDLLTWLKIESANLKFDNFKDYIIYSDVMLTPNNITLDNFYLNLNSGQSEFLGSIKIDSSAKVTSITNDFRISSFDVDDFFLTSQQNAYLSSGSLLRKFLWLNDLPSVNNLSLVFDKLIYRGEEFSNQSSLKLQTKQGYLEISELNLTSDRTNLKATLSVDISTQTPAFQLNIVADKFHYEAPQDAKIKDDSAPAKRNSAANQFFAIPSLEGFNGIINLDANNLKLDEVQLQNVKLSGKLKDGNMPDTAITCNIYGGNFTYKGLVGIKDYKTINGNITLNNADLGQLLPDLTGTSNVGGAINISASLTSMADSKEAFAKETNSEIKFNANAPIVTGYGLSDLVNKMFYPLNFKQELQQPDKLLTNPASKTIFKQASGTVILGKDRENKFSINLSAPAINGILSGKIDLPNNSINGLANIIFITGSRQKQIPLNIATALKGDMKNISSSSNLDQVRQYLGLPKLNTSAPLGSPAANSQDAASITDTANVAIPMPDPIQAPPPANSNIKAGQ